VSTPFQRKLYGGVAAGVALLAAFGLGEGAGSRPTRTVEIPRIITVTQTATPSPAPTRTVYRVSDACTVYLADAQQLQTLVASFTSGYGGLPDYLAQAFAAIETHDDATLATVRIKIANADHATSDAISRTLELLSKMRTDQINCANSK